MRTFVRGVLALLLLAAGCFSGPEEAPPSGREPPPAPSRGTNAGASAERPPNVVYVIADDLGWPYHSFLGDPVVHMPHLDRLAREGTLFTHGYVTASVCNPSLRSLWTGQEPFPRRPGLRGPRPDPRRGLPGRLRARGYASLQTGKFWEPDFASAGFTEGTKTRERAVQRWMGDAERIGRETMEPLFDFISRHADEPFFIWFAPALPHRPWDAPAPYLRFYRALHGELSPATRRYYANVTRLDEAVGRLIEYLEDTGLRDRTLIVYLSDNGYGPRPEDGLPIAPWSGAKGTTSELGFRTPVIFSWPGRVPAGAVRDDLISTLDLFPTVLGWAGASPPADGPGLDLRPALTGAPGPRDEIVGRMAGVRVLDPAAPRPGPKTSAYFLRNRRWHYVWAPSTGQELLFDVEADPWERTNVLSSRREVATRLRARVEAWRAQARPRGDA